MQACYVPAPRCVGTREEAGERTEGGEGGGGGSQTLLSLLSSRSVLAPPVVLHPFEPGNEGSLHTHLSVVRVRCRNRISGFRVPLCVPCCLLVMKLLLRYLFIHKSTMVCVMDVHTTLK